ncbi:MAG: N-acetyltransferase [Gemmatimonadetes bacterium]|nr:N-acetyltransferase [Gemmatimonadota bacterium]
MNRPSQRDLVRISPRPQLDAATGGESVRKIGPAVSVRPARLGDMRHVEALINRFARNNLMLPKTAEQLSRNFREFVVAVDADEAVVGCVALRVYNETLAEVGSLAVDDAAHGQGVGRKLVERLLEEARSLGLKTVFALTLQELFFHRLGFRTVQKEMFPLKVWADCRMCPKLHACDEVAVAIEV